MFFLISWGRWRAKRRSRIERRRHVRGFYHVEIDNKIEDHKDRSEEKEQRVGIYREGTCMMMTIYFGFLCHCSIWFRAPLFSNEKPLRSTAWEWWLVVVGEIFDDNFFIISCTQQKIKKINTINTHTHTDKNRIIPSKQGPPSTCEILSPSHHPSCRPGNGDRS